MLNIFNASNFIYESVRNYNCFSINHFIRNDNYLNTNEFEFDKNHFNTKCFQYETSSFDFKKTLVSIDQSSLTFTTVVLFLYIIFQSLVNVFISNQVTIARLYFDQMMLLLISLSLYDETVFYKTFALFTGLNHVQIFEFFDLSMFMTNST